MAELHAFRGLRYDPGHVGSLSDVVAPPYDVIDGPLQEALYQRHPANVVRLILNRRERGDEGDDARYDRAARCFSDWVKEGVLQSDPAPSLYVYHQSFEYEGNRLLDGGSWDGCDWSDLARGGFTHMKRLTPRPRRIV